MKVLHLFLPPGSVRSEQRKMSLLAAIFEKQAWRNRAVENSVPLNHLCSHMEEENFLQQVVPL